MLGLPKNHVNSENWQSWVILNCSSRESYLLLATISNIFEYIFINILNNIYYQYFLKYFLHNISWFFWVGLGQVRQMASTLQTSKNVDVKQISSPKFFCSFGQQWGSSKCQAGHRGWNVFWCSPSHSCSAQRLLLQAVHTWKPEGTFPPGRHFFTNSEKHLELDVLRKYPNLGKATSEIVGWLSIWWNSDNNNFFFTFQHKFDQGIDFDSTLLVVQASDYLQAAEIFDVSVRLLKNLVTSSNALWCWVFARHFNLADLENWCWTFINFYFAEVSLSDDFTDMQFIELKKLVESGGCLTLIDTSQSRKILLNFLLIFFSFYQTPWMPERLKYGLQSTAGSKQNQSRGLLTMLNFLLSWGTKNCGKTFAASCHSEKWHSLIWRWLPKYFLESRPLQSSASIKSLPAAGLPPSWSVAAGWEPFRMETVDLETWLKSLISGGKSGRRFPWLTHLGQGTHGFTKNYNRAIFMVTPPPF